MFLTQIEYVIHNFIILYYLLFLSNWSIWKQMGPFLRLLDDRILDQEKCLRNIQTISKISQEEVQWKVCGGPANSSLRGRDSDTQIKVTVLTLDPVIRHPPSWFICGSYTSEFCSYDGWGLALHLNEHNSPYKFLIGWHFSIELIFTLGNFLYTCNFRTHSSGCKGYAHGETPLMHCSK